MLKLTDVELHWKHFVGLEEGIERICNWYLKSNINDG